jgi:hypothetical protein
MKLVRLIKMYYVKPTLNSVYAYISLIHFSIPSGMKQGETFSPILLNFVLEYAIRKVQENQVGLKLNWDYQLLVYADDVNLLRDNIDTIKKNTETPLVRSKEVVLDVNEEKTKYMLLSRHQNVGQNHDINIANRSFENVVQFKYLGTTATNEDLIPQEINEN